MSVSNRIETQRLVLRPPVYSDGPSLHTLLSDPDVCRYSPYLPIAGIADAYFIIVEWHERWSQGLRTYMITNRYDPRNPVGFINVGSDEELGGLLSPQESGRGLASEALRATVEALGLRTAWTIIDAEHKALIHTLGKVNIRLERTLPRYRVHPQISPEMRDCVLLRQQPTQI